MQRENVGAPCRGDIGETTDVAQLARRIAVLVDNDQAFGDVISDLLTEEFGWSVVVCTGADQAEPMVMAVHTDLVLLDLVMPGRGREVLRALKTNPLTQPVPVIVCTAATLVDRVREELMALGAAAILAKPFDIEDLITHVGEYIPRRAHEIRPDQVLQQFVVCNSENREAPQPPPGFAPTLGACSDCDRPITWIGYAGARRSRLPHVCGRCAVIRLQTLV